MAPTESLTAMPGARYRRLPGAHLLILFGLAICAGAALLFLVQPLFARLALPLLGGAPAVWNTAMVFYQAALLAGYAYAHLATRWLGPRRQALVHLAVLAVAALALPIAVPAGWTPPAGSSPVPWLLALLAVAVGLPFFAVAATSPLLQAWFATTGHPAARNPYVLYTASNLGSVLALLGYPAVVEPTLRLAAQSRLWSLGYAGLVALVAACAVGVWRATGAGSRGAAGPPAIGARLPAAAPRTEAGVPAPPPPGRARRARWVLLAAVPSSLMLSVTTYLGTDIAAIPLLWVVPLALYLLTFILVFGRRRRVPHRFWVEALPLALLPAVLVLVARANEPLAMVLLAHLLAFFVAAMVCHGELAADRPDPSHLTGFYLWLALGGVLGGAFTALAAPVVFTGIVEYPLVLVAVTLLPARPRAAWEGRGRRELDIVLPLMMGGTLLAVIRGLEGSCLGPGAIGPAVGTLTLGCVFFARRPLRFSLALAVLLVAGSAYRGAEGQLLHAERSFFGVSRVSRDPDGQYHLLMHGTTLHGMQALEPARRREPLTYYHASGPVGDVFAALDRLAERRAVAVVGLGAGSLACYGRPGARWTFYEIDPAVLRIASDPRHFSFLHDCPPRVFVRLGDARLVLAGAPDAAYDLIVLDAYSSDAPPLHLITLEAVRLYLSKLAPGGVLLFNVSNRHLRLAPVLGALARAAGLVARARDDAAVGPAERARGKTESHWIVMARRVEDLGALATDPRWSSVAPADGAPWTDDFASLLTAFRWR